jgi:hypothetical protein
MTQKIEFGACTGGSWHIVTHLGLNLGLGGRLGCPFVIAMKMFYVKSMQNKNRYAFRVSYFSKVVILVHGVYVIWFRGILSFR